MSKPSYIKRIGLDKLKDNDLQRLEKVILKMGYSSTDYRINYFNETRELIVTNQELNRDLKTIRRTVYPK